MTSAVVRERGGPDAEAAKPGLATPALSSAVPTRAPRSLTAGTPARLDGVRAALGNRGFGNYVRTLARQPAPQSAPAPKSAPAHAVTVYLASPPPAPPIHASARATPDNRSLAALIDEIDKLSNAAVLERRRSEALRRRTPRARTPRATNWHSRLPSTSRRIAP